jgi:hypothetical protein
MNPASDVTLSVRTPIGSGAGMQGYSLPWVPPGTNSVPERVDPTKRG